MSGQKRGPWVSSVPVVVSDRQAAIEWYTKLLGLEVIAAEKHWVTVGRKGKGAELHLCQASENHPPIPLEPGPSGIVICLPGEFEGECRRLRDEGVEFAREPVEAPWGWYATIRDPDGNEHTLVPDEEL